MLKIANTCKKALVFRQGLLLPKAFIGSPPRAAVDGEQRPCPKWLLVYWGAQCEVTGEQRGLGGGLGMEWERVYLPAAMETLIPLVLPKLTLLADAALVVN